MRPWRNQLRGRETEAGCGFCSGPGFRLGRVAEEVARHQEISFEHGLAFELIQISCHHKRELSSSLLVAHATKTQIVQSAIGRGLAARRDPIIVAKVLGAHP